jgi:hypothetical protein|tara:strand:- start:456 stop:653 length:198 start_codon:yes stop_codon:yes gene_type:complete
MGDFIAATDSISPFTAIIWCFYPIGVLVGIELFLRAINNDDDDDQDGGKGIRVNQNEPLYAPVGA